MTNTVHYTDDFEPDSVVIDHVYYDAKRNELYILLHSGTVCGYLSVPQNTYDRFKSSNSAGTFWNAYVKYNFRGTSGDVNFAPAEKAEQNMTNPQTQENKKFSVIVNVQGDLRFDLDAENIVAATKQVYDLIEKSVVDGTYYVKEVKQNQ